MWFVPFLFFEVVQIVGHVELVLRVEYEVDTFNVHDLLRFELGITTNHNNVGSGVSVDDFPDHLPSFFLCNIRDATRVNHEYIRSIFFSHSHGSFLFKAVLDRGGFGEIQLAS